MFSHVDNLDDDEIQERIQAFLNNLTSNQFQLFQHQTLDQIFQQNREIETRIKVMIGREKTQNDCPNSITNKPKRGG